MASDVYEDFCEASIHAAKCLVAARKKHGKDIPIVRANVREKVVWVIVELADGTTERTPFRWERRNKYLPD